MPGRELAIADGLSRVQRRQGRPLEDVVVPVEDDEENGEAPPDEQPNVQLGLPEEKGPVDDPIPELDPEPDMAELAPWRTWNQDEWYGDITYYKVTGQPQSKVLPRRRCPGSITSLRGLHAHYAVDNSDVSTRSMILGGQGSPGWHGI